MTLQASASSGSPLTLLEIDTEFSGPAVPKLTNFYKGGGYVPPHQCNSTVPTSGTIKVLDFLGRDAVFRCGITTGYTVLIDGSSFYSGYSTNAGFGFVLGSQSGNTTIGLSASSLTTCTPAALYTLAAWNPKADGGNGQYTYIDYFAVASATDLSAVAWTSITISGSGYTTTTYNRPGTGSFDGSYTRWQWPSSTTQFLFNYLTNYTIDLAINVL